MNAVDGGLDLVGIWDGCARADEKLWPALAAYRVKCRQEFEDRKTRTIALLFPEGTDQKNPALQQHREKLLGTARKEAAEAVYATLSSDEKNAMKAEFTRFDEARQREEEDKRRKQQEAWAREQEAEKKRQEQELKEETERARRRELQDSQNYWGSEDHERDRAVAREKEKRREVKGIEPLHDDRKRCARVARRAELHPVFASDFFAGYDEEPDWLVEGLLVARESVFIGGPHKSLKTLMALNLAICLASGEPFLGFSIPCFPLRVAFYSGESGIDTLRREAKAIAESMGLRIEALPIAFQTRLPKLTERQDREAFALETRKFDVAIIDPLYMCLPGINAANLFEIGEALNETVRIVSETGCGTIIFIHHTHHVDPRRCKPLDLADLSHAGSAEVARQWLMLSPRRMFKPDGPTVLHELWVSYGGSAGQCGIFAVNVDKGRLTKDFTGNRWVVSTMTHDQVKEQQAAERKERGKKKQEKTNDDRAAKVLRVVPDEGITASRLRKESGISNGTVFKNVLAQLEEQGQVEIDGDGAKRTVKRVVK